MWQMKWIVAKKDETVLDVALDAMIALLGASMLTGPQINFLSPVRSNTTRQIWEASWGRCCHGRCDVMNKWIGSHG